jgi:PKHD-type hydroxylase
MKQFLPSPDLAYNHTLHAWWENAFTDEEIEAICNIGDRLPIQASQIGGSSKEKIVKEIRTSINSWIDAEGWIADRLEHVARNLNGQFFGLDLWGFGEKFQYTIYKYKKKEQAHYNWHMDTGSGGGPPRKLSMVLQLSDPSEYEGGELELLTGTISTIVKKQKGIIHAFPSYVLHRVTPVTKGIRRTLVVWISGPRFR